MYDLEICITVRVCMIYYVYVEMYWELSVGVVSDYVLLKEKFLLWFVFLYEIVICGYPNFICGTNFAHRYVNIALLRQNDESVVNFILLFNRMILLITYKRCNAFVLLNLMLLAIMWFYIESFKTMIFLHCCG